MNAIETAEVVRRFNQAFQEHNPALLDDIVAQDCVMESIQPAPDGTRYEGYDVNLAFWQAMAADRVNRFEVEDTLVMGDRANIRWRFHFGDGGSVRGVSLMHVRDGRIVEALAYSKSPGQSAPLPGTADSSVTRETVERFNRAFEAHRPEDLDDLIGEGCILENTTPAPDGARYEGREACLDFWKSIASSTHLVFEAEEIWASGDRGIIRWQLRWGEHETDRTRGVNIMRVRDGKILEARGYVKG